MKTAFLEQFARIGQALSNPSRLALLDLICQSEKSVERLVEQSRLPLKNVSAQLKALREAGLISSRKEGKYVYYRLSDPKVAEFWSNLQDFSSRQLGELQEITAKLIGAPDLEGVDRRELLARAKRGDLVVIDVRPRDEYDSAHISYAISVPLDELKGRLAQLPKNKEIIAYCRGPFCVLAHDAVKLLRKNGFKAARLDDGVQEWKSAGLPIDSAV